MQEPDWSRVDTVVAAVLAARSGIAPLRAFVDARLTDRQISAAFRRGVLERPRKGWYVDPALAWQVKRAVRVGGVATCVTAAALLGIPVPPGSHEVLHVAVDEHDTHLRHNRDKRRVVHVEDAAEVHRHRGALHDVPTRGCASLVDLLLQLACCVPPDWFVVALDAVLHVPRGGSPLLPQEDYDLFAARLPPRFRALLALVDPRSESPLETLLRLALDRAGIGWVDLHFAPNGRHRVDFLLRGKVIVETDGAAFHDPERDAIRDAQLRALGCVVLRFTYDEVVFGMGDVLARIRAVLETR